MIHAAPDFFVRFLDDCLIGWSHGHKKFDEFVDYLNNCHKSIKFTAEVSEISVPFLDLNIHIDGGDLWTDLYCKPTDSHNYLHFDSAHPEHNKLSLPYSQYLRLKRICSRNEDFLKHSQMITFHFLRRGYPKTLLSRTFDKVKNKSREEILNKPMSKKEKDETVFLITTYIPGFTAMKDLVNKNWGILSRSSTTKRLSEVRLIHGYCRPKNLRDDLVKAKLPNLKDSQPSGKALNCDTRNKCKTLNCKYCAALDRSGRITSTFTGCSYFARKKCDMQKYESYILHNMQDMLNAICRTNQT